MINWLEKVYNGLLNLLWFPRVIANLLRSLTMDEHGFSLKKLGFVFATFEGAKMSHEIIAKTTFTMNAGLTLVAYWLIYGGILVGIYSFSDITDGISKVKGSKGDKDNQPPPNPQP
jgi:hypothetical protein